MSKPIFAKTILLIAFLLALPCAQAQEEFESKEVKPSLGIGVGVFNYFGDVNSIGNHSALNNPLGYELHIARKLSNYSDLGFSFLTGTIIGNERSIDRNLNFRTDIYSISVYGSFNLDYLFNWSDLINPYMTIGFESFEYNNKGDLVDANGSLYHYWDDGTIRTISQNSPLSNQASLMQRDYKYETDLRAANLDGFGKYPQLAIALPVGLGVNLNISDRLSFKISSTFHFTFTDLIDNVSKDGSGVREGNSFNDYFTYNSISLHYDFISSSRKNSSESFLFPDYFDLDIEDTDGDGVFDGVDICPFTPPGVLVNQKGCPLDDDYDGVPNYRDKELLTSDSSFVNEEGVALSDNDFYEQHLQYVDSAEVPIEILYRIAGSPQKAGNFRILLGEFSNEISERLAQLFIAEGDVIGIQNRESKTAYLTKKYAELNNVEQRRDELLNKGFPQATIVVWDGNSYFTLYQWDLLAQKDLQNRFKSFYENKEELEGMYALKLGEIKADALLEEKAKFFEYEDVVVLKGDSGKSDFVIGPFINKVEAKQYLQEVDREKYPNAEVITVKKGKSKSVGVVIQDTEPMRPLGPNNWNKIRKNPKQKQGSVLDKLEGSLVIDFGKIADLEIKNKISKIKSQIEVAQIKDTLGNTVLITKKPQSNSYINIRIDDFKKQGVLAEVKKVENGKLVSVDLNDVLIKVPVQHKPVLTKDSTSIKNKIDSVEQKITNKESRPNSSSNYNQWQDVLSRVNGSFVIDFGKSSEEKIKEIQKQLDSEIDIVEIMTINGDNKLITPEPQVKSDAEKIIKRLEGKGIEAILVQVKDGELIPAKSIEDLKSPNNDPQIKSEEKLDDYEDNYVVKIGTINEKTTLEERDKLINTPETIKIKKSNGDIDVISQKTTKNEEEAYTNKIKYISLGFPTSKVAYFKDGKAEVIRKEELEGKYTVSMGSFKTNVTNDQVNSILSLPDIESIETHNPEMTTYVIGTYDSPEEAKKSVEDLVKKGLEPSIVKIKDGKIKEVELSVVFDDLSIQKLTALKEQSKQVKTDEIVFRVQLGAYREKIDMNIFQGVKTLSFPTSLGVTKYVTGSFITYQQAYIHKIDMRKMGFSGCFVVAYKDGKRIKVTDLVNQEKYQKVKKSVSPIEQQLNNISDTAKQITVKTTQPEVSFKVQIGAYKGSEMGDSLSEFSDLEIEIYGQYKRYISGEFTSYAEANEHKKEIKGKGFDQACVVAYNDGKRVETPGGKANIITKDELIKKTEKSTTNKTVFTYDLSKVSIMVQVGLFRGEIPIELKEQYSKLPDLTKQVTNYGVIRYMTGNFKNMSEAAAYKEELIKQGFPDAFLVAYYSNDRKTMQEIVEILKKAK